MWHAEQRSRNTSFPASVRFSGVTVLTFAHLALASSKWAKVSAVTPQNRIEAGKEVFRLVCSSCHTVDGYNAIRPFIHNWPEDYIYEQLGQLNVLASVMPPFQGNAAERDALAGWLATLGDQETQP